MKKWGILALVIAGGLLLALRYFSDRGLSRTFLSSVPGQEQPVGVALPPSAKSFAVPQTADLSPGGTGSYASIVLPEEGTPYKGACEGGSLNEMRGTHGRYWGHFARSSSFSSTDTNKMYDFTGSYVGCVALARNDINLCDSLPGEAEESGIKVGFEMSPRYACRKRVGLLFQMAASTRDADPCNPAAPKFSGKDCEAVLKGQKPAGDSAGGTGPDNKDNKKDKSKKPRPASEAECSGDADCIEKLRRHISGGGQKQDGKEASKRSRPASEADCGGKAECIKKFRLFASGGGQKQDGKEAAGKSRPESEAECDGDADCIRKFRQHASDGGQKQDGKNKSRKSPPASEAECGGKAECIEKFRLYTAIKNGRVSGCPRTAVRSLCEALIAKSEKPCATRVKDMSQFYCAAVARVRKATGGFVGVSQEEIKADFERKRLEQAEATRQKIESEKIQAELNKNIKKMSKTE